MGKRLCWSGEEIFLAKGNRNAAQCTIYIYDGDSSIVSYVVKTLKFVLRIDGIGEAQFVL